MDQEITFEELGLAPEILDAVKAAGYETPSPIQAKAIPALLQGKNLLGTAQTGTGKTAAFALPLLSRIEFNTRETSLLVLTPTRELSIQVAEAIQQYAMKLPKVHVVPVYGGQDISVGALAAIAGSPENIETTVIHIQLYIYFLRLRHDGDRRGRRVNPSAALRHRNPLHAVRAALIFQS